MIPRQSSGSGMHVHYARNRIDITSVLKAMDRWILIAAVIFLITEVFALVALWSPNWITSYDGRGECEMRGEIERI